MSRNGVFCAFLAIFSFLADHPPLRAAEATVPRLLTVRGTWLFSQAKGLLVVREEIPPLTELVSVGNLPNLLDASGTAYRPVSRVEGRTGWVREADVVPLPDALAPSSGLPALLAKQPSSVRRAWIALEGLIRENQALRTPSPQPYVARAEIWARASNYEEAVRDMQTAWTLSRQRGASVAEQARLLSRIQEILRQLAQTPRPRYFGDAEAHYKAGFEAYHQGQLDVALHHFDSAVQLAPEDKVSWYYRALTNKRLNNDAEAERDIVIAVYQERSAIGDQPRWWLTQFTRVQGPLRAWMESYRSGTSVPR